MQTPIGTNGFSPLHNDRIGNVPLSIVTPFTYRDNVTYAELLYALVNWFNREHLPELDNILEGYKKKYDDVLSDIIKTKDDWKKFFDDFMADVISRLEALNDEAVSNLVRNKLSKLRQALDERYATLDMLRMNYITPQMFGAKGDGKTDDSDALIEFFATLSSKSNKAVGYIPSGGYIHTKPINLSGNEVGFEVKGASLELTQLLYRGTSGTGLMGIGSKGITFKDITIDAGFNVTRNTSHGASFRNPIGVNWDNVKFTNYSESSLLMFTADGDENKYGYCNIDRTVSDGLNVANNGLNVVNLRDVFGDANRAYNGGMSVANSPSYGIQLKNVCINVHLTNSYAENWKGGLVMASDGTVGPKNCSITGSSKNCNYGVLIGKAELNKITAFVDSPKERAVNFGSNAQYNTVNAILSNIPSSMIPVRHGFHYNTVVLENVLNFTGSKLFELTPSTTNNTNILVNMVNAPDNEIDLVQDDSNRNNNKFFSYGRLSRLSDSSDSASGDSAGYLFFDKPGKSDTWLSVSHQNGSFNFRGNGVNRLVINPDYVSPGLDDTQYLGATNRRWKTLFAVNSTINTSDAREKTNITPINNETMPAVLRAWEKVEYVEFNWASENSDRKHVGLIAQQVINAFESEGLDPFTYGIVCYDKWEGEDAEYDENGNVIKQSVPAGDRYSLRYTEAAALESALMRWKIKMLESK